MFLSACFFKIVEVYLPKLTKMRDKTIIGKMIESSSVHLTNSDKELIAATVGVSKRTVYNYCNGRATSETIARAIAKAIVKLSADKANMYKKYHVIAGEELKQLL